MSSPISPLSGTTSASSSTTTPTASPNADVDKQTFLLASERKVERPTKLQTTAPDNNNTNSSSSINGQSPMTTSAGVGGGDGGDGGGITSPTSPIGGGSSVDGGTGSMVTSPSFLPEMPQWKRDLIQRRKANAARTAATAAVTQTKPFETSPAVLTPPSSQRHNDDDDHHDDDCDCDDDDDGGDDQQASFCATAADKLVKKPTKTQTSPPSTTTTTTTGNNKQKSSPTGTKGKKKQQHITASPSKATTSHQHRQATAAVKQNAKLTKANNSNNKTNNTKMPATSPTKSATAAASIGGGHYTMEHEQRTPTDRKDAIGEVGGAVVADDDDAEQSTMAPIPKQRSLYSSRIQHTKEQQQQQAEGDEKDSAEEFVNKPRTAASPTSPNAVLINKFNGAGSSNNTTTTITRLASSSSVREHELASFDSSSPRLSVKCGTYSPTTPTSLSMSSIGANATTAPTARCQSHSKYESERTSSSKTTTTTKTSASAAATATTIKATTPTRIEALSGFGVSSSASGIGFGSDALALALKIEKTVINPTPKISTKLQNNQFIKNQQQQQQLLLNASKSSNKFSGNPMIITSPSSATTTTTTTTATNNGSPTKTAAALSKKKMVAVQEMKKTQAQGSQHHRNGGEDDTAAKDFDPSEDLSYGPGIVSKLRCRYLSLALRESMEKQRHCLDNMRRATSLNNLLDRCADEDDEEEDDDVEEVVHDETDDGGEEAPLTPSSTATSASVTPLSSGGGGARKAGILKNRDSVASIGNSGGGVSSMVAKKTATFKKNDAIAAQNGHRMSQSYYGKSSSSGNNCSESNGADSNRSSRQVKRGNDSLKRARSVEALLCERSPWNFAANRSSLGGGGAGAQASPPTCVTIEDKIHNARDRLISGTDSMPPKRLTSIIDDTERPPPDLVKQTLKLFEASANKRGRGLNRGTANGKGDVATKVANYKSIIKEQKPAIVYPKPQQSLAGGPTSPTKKLGGTPPLKPVAKPVVAAADLLSSPIGRKTMAASVVATSTPELQHSTPRASGAFGKSITGAGGLSEQTPDIIPRHKLLAEGGGGAAVDSPLTALSRKLEKLTIDSNGKEQAAPTTKKLFAAAAEAHGSSVGGVVSVDDDDAPTKQQQQQQNNNKKRTAASRSDSESHSSSDSHSDSDDDDNGENDDKSSRTPKERRARGASYSLVDAEREGDSKQQSNNRADIVQACAGIAGPATASSASDQSDDDEYGRKKRDDRSATNTAAAAPTTRNKHIAQSALDNIAKAGTTQQFKFGNTAPSEIPTSVLNNATGKQIGVIRPLQGSSNSPASSSSTQQLTSREIEKNRINEMKKSSAAVHDSTAATNNTTTTSTALGKSSLSSSAATASPTTSLDTVINTNTGKLTSSSSASSSASSSPSGYSELDAAMGGKTNNSPLWALRKKRPTPPTAVAENTTMVFNFSNRKEVPDYIENDGGVIYRRKRELPKPNESGFVLLNDLALDTSTDTDYDDFSMCPPSPCDVEFENANIVIDGKSSIRQKTKDSMFRVQFNDTLTSTFEYPSEASLIVEDSFMNDPFFAAAAAVTASANKAPTTEDELISAYENLSLEDSLGRHHQHHHVAVDEIIPIPASLGGSAAAAANGGATSPSKNILGSLPLDDADRRRLPLEAPITTNPPLEQQQLQEQHKQPERPARQQNASKATRKALSMAALQPNEQAPAAADNNNPPSCFEELKLNGRRNRSAPLGFYTPLKAPIDSLFQLGITRAAPLGSSATSNGNGHDSSDGGGATTNGNGSVGIGPFGGNGSIVGITDGLNGSTTPSAAAAAGDGDDESLQYLKPANDDLTIAYSEGTQKTDLLY